jgi:hypothetical protein
MTDYGHMVNEGGMDAIINNTRTRATTTNPLGINWMDGIGTPISTTPGATTTITAANLLVGVITMAPSTGCTATFDTATNIVSAVNTASAGAQAGDYISALIMNGSSTNSITLAAGTGGSFDTNQATRTIPANTSKWVLICLNNVTSGSQAYTIYF